MTTHAEKGCGMGGISTLDIDYRYRMKGAGSLFCPREPVCGENLHIAKQETKTLIVESDEWSDL